MNAHTGPTYWLSCPDRHENWVYPTLDAAILGMLKDMRERGCSAPDSTLESYAAHFAQGHMRVAFHRHHDREGKQVRGLVWTITSLGPDLEKFLPALSTHRPL